MIRNRRSVEEWGENTKEKYHRQHFPVKSLKAKLQYTPEEMMLISYLTCPKCKSSLFREVEISQGEKGEYLKCRSCARMYFAVEPDPPKKSWKTPKRDMGSVEKTIICAECGKERTGKMKPNTRYCSPACYYEALKKRTKVAYETWKVGQEGSKNVFFAP